MVGFLLEKVQWCKKKKKKAVNEDLSNIRVKKTNKILNEIRTQHLAGNIFIASNQVQTSCPVDFSFWLRIAAPVSTSSARASATPTPHSAAMAVDEAEEGEQDTNVTDPTSCGNAKVEGGC